MAVELADAYISLVPSARGFGKQISAELGDVDGIGRDAGDRTSRGFMSSFGSGIAGLGKVVGAAALVGTVAVGGLLVSAVGAASDLNESMSKVNVVFGDSAPIIQDWAKGAATALGMSNQQALEAAGTFGNLFSAMGIATPVAAEMSQKMIGLASDLASFNNASPEDVLAALKSGLVGETEPLRAFGVNLNDARLKAEALSLGLVKSTVDTGKLSTAQETAEKAARKAAEALKTHGAGSIEFADATRDAEQANAKLAAVMEGKVPDSMDAATKAQAAYSLIQKDTSLAQGDFARTSDGLANKQRILSAQFTDIKAKVGTALLPALTGVASLVSEKVLPAFTGLGDKVGPIIETIVGAFRAFFAAFKAGGDDVTSSGLAGFFERLANVVSPIVGALVGGFKAFFAAFKAGDGDVTSSGFAGMMEKIANVLRGLWDFLSSVDWGAVFGNIVDAVRPLVESVGSALIAWWGLLLAAATTVFDLIKDNRETLESVAGVIKNVLATAFDVASKAVDGLSGVFNFLATHMELVKAIAIPLIAAFATYKAIMLGVQLVTFLVTTATTIWTAAQAALNVVMALNPIGIVVAAIAALVVGVVYAYTHFETFRNIVDTAWQILQIGFNWVRDHWPLLLAILTGPIGIAVMLIIQHFDTIKDFIGGVIGWIADHWQLILAIITGPIGLAVLLVTKNFDTIKDVFTSVKDWIWDRINDIVGFFVGIPGRIVASVAWIGDTIRNGIIDAAWWVGTKVNEIVGWFTGMPGRLAGAFGGMFNGISDAFRSALNWIIDRWNGLRFGVPKIDLGPLGSFGGGTFGVPQIPRLAAGGVFSAATLAVIGEKSNGRNPEIAAPQSAIRDAVADALHGFRGGGVTINTLGKPDAHELAREVTWAMKTQGM